MAKTANPVRLQQQLIGNAVLTVTTRKDDNPAAVQAAIVNETKLSSFPLVLDSSSRALVDASNARIVTTGVCSPLKYLLINDGLVRANLYSINVMALVGRHKINAVVAVPVLAPVRKWCRSWHSY